MLNAEVIKKESIVEENEMTLMQQHETEKTIIQCYDLTGFCNKYKLDYGIVIIYKSKEKKSVFSYHDSVTDLFAYYDLLCKVV